jgi:molecular chaperone GrpE
MKKKEQSKKENSEADLKKEESASLAGQTGGEEIEVVPSPEEKQTGKGTEEIQIDVLKEQLEKSEQQCKEIEDRLLRMAADFDNYKKRTAKEFANLVKYSNESLITRLCDTLDNFERALDSAKNSTDFDGFHQGIELIYNHLKDILEKEGLKEIKTKGEKFDPYIHEAISQIESDEFPEGVIVEEISKGYILNDRVIKAPKVIVSMGKKEKEKGKEKKEEEEKEEW